MPGTYLFAKGEVNRFRIAMYFRAVVAVFGKTSRLNKMEVLSERITVVFFSKQVICNATCIRMRWINVSNVSERN